MADVGCAMYDVGNTIKYEVRELSLSRAENPYPNENNKSEISKSEIGNRKMEDVRCVIWEEYD